MRHIRPGCGFNERVVQRGFVKRHVHFGERHGRAQRDEKRAKLPRLEKASEKPEKKEPEKVSEKTAKKETKKDSAKKTVKKKG